MRAWMGVLVMLLLLGLSGCGQGDKPPPTVGEIEQRIREKVDISSLKVGDHARLKRLYGITRGEVAEFVLYRAPSNIKADEILVLKVKDAKYLDSVQEKIQKRAARQAASFKDYVPEEYYLVEKKILKVEGNYILYVVFPEAPRIAETFKEFF